jgi:hypothetical protein
VLAAPVWNAFMVPAHGDDCSDFPQPTTAFESSPFFGNYASTGRRGSYSDSDNNGYDDNGDGQTQTNGPQTGNGNGGQGYDPNLYAAPPQQAPQQAPAPQNPTPPAPGNNGNGNGGGQGNGPPQ